MSDEGFEGCGDYKHPDWDAAGRVHDWRNYVSDELKEMWETFTDAQKLAIARMADARASAEEWD